MNITKWLEKNTSSLRGRTVALTGSTGGLGRELSRYILSLGADLILLDRNKFKQAALIDELSQRYPTASVRGLNLDLEDMESVRACIDALLDIGIDMFIHNAGAYSIPRHKTPEGFDNVFAINFLSPYYMIRKLLPMLDKRCGRVVVVGSIAHDYSKIDTEDVDFSHRTRASLVYGNAKRYLMYSLYPLFEDGRAALAVTHPGITFTNITAHYPKLVFALIKHPMKLIFMKPRKAALSILRGLFDKTESFTWIGPRCFNVWGIPKKSGLKSASPVEREKIAEIADKLYRKIDILP